MPTRLARVVFDCRSRLRRSHCVVYDTLGVQPCRICCSRVQAMDSSSPTRRNLLHCAGSTEQKTSSQEACIGNQTGGRVWLVLETSDFWGDYEAMQVAGVRFSEVPRT
ncbi:hypothetical protein DYB28_008368 [Aphanomyces astaci]|uniref:Uncharacterized protein n=1 Tax=Aphanomyces astaci TaxID=112090 RepID=A0A397A978_APHAT|nr:hypothetical protein DYB36_000893 [Aphanomyces astaci]RHY66761.1 hypothetical protein DYB30_009157 [Aphanomyces astaci]RHZ01400.1 hypothetical protein DYB31_015726 [Aphanomyces astaci]RLO09795.1 hypothetical protein DYB28_008368 [Aphanomyces astaci]